MNCLIIYPEECVTPFLALLRGARAIYALEAHELQQGLTLSVGLYGGKLGKAFVEKISPGEVQLSFSLEREAPRRFPTEAIVAVPRPQTVKKVLQLAATVGLAKVHFVKSSGVVKSYMQSKSLLEENMQLELLKGLEQGCDTCAPQVTVYKDLSSLFEMIDAPKRQNDLRLIADTGLKNGLGTLVPDRIGAERAVLFAIGPESGWESSEIERFARRGFLSVSLGDRMLRVDTALCFLVAQIDLLRGEATC